MLKYDLIPEQLVYEGVVHPEQFFVPEPMLEDLIQRTHCSDYWAKLKSLNLSKIEERRTGFPLSNQLIEREITIAQGTLDASFFALEHGVAFNVAGGTHHAFRDRGEGFCLLNDVALAANELLFQKIAQRILVVDLDVHQGNGTARIFEQEPRVFTLSFHGAENFPLHKEKSSLDVPLPTGTKDEKYLETLHRVLNDVLSSFEPDFVFYVSGVDVLETDRLGKLCLTLGGCKERDEMVIRACHSRKLPLVCVMGGGYSHRIADIVNAHCQTFQVAEYWYG